MLLYFYNKVFYKGQEGANPARWAHKFFENKKI